MRILFVVPAVGKVYEGPSEVYLKDYDSVSRAIENLEHYFRFYNQKRLHQSLNYRPPASVYFSKQKDSDRVNQVFRAS